jgi:hypothetical protein
MEVVTGVYLTDIGTMVMYCDVDVAPFRMTARNVASLRLVGTSRTFVGAVARFDHAAGRVQRLYPLYYFADLPCFEAGDYSCRPNAH